MNNFVKAILYGLLATFIYHLGSLVFNNFQVESFFYLPPSGYPGYDILSVILNLFGFPAFFVLISLSLYNVLKAGPNNLRWKIPLKNFIMWLVVLLIFILLIFNFLKIPLLHFGGDSKFFILLTFFNFYLPLYITGIIFSTFFSLSRFFESKTLFIISWLILLLHYLI